MSLTRVAAIPATVDAALHARRSIRAFLPDPVDDALIRQVLRSAARAPSGSNIQPWQVHVLTGQPLRRLIDRVCEAYDSKEGSAYLPEYRYYPDQFFEPYLSRRRKVGWSLYELLGIGKRDGERMHAQHRRNFTFFDAPVGLMFTIDRRMNQGSWLDYGMFLQSVMLAAQAQGLSTCPQAAWIAYHRIIAQELNLPDTQQVVCGVALGHADPDAPENALVSERADLDEFVTWHR